MTKPILFAKEKEKWGEFSNFYGKKEARKKGFNLVIDGKEWQTAEHYFQAQKFNRKEDEWYRELIRKTNTPYKSKMLANMKLTSFYAYKWTVSPDDDRLLKDIISEAKKKGIRIRDDWEDEDEMGIEKRVIVMMKGVLAKFEQNKYLRDVLLSTGDREIREHTHDKYWGDGLDNSGENVLGIILMCVRELLSGKD